MGRKRGSIIDTHCSSVAGIGSSFRRFGVDVDMSLTVELCDSTRL